MPEVFSRGVGPCGGRLNLSVLTQRDVDILHLLELVLEGFHLGAELALPFGTLLLLLFHEFGLQ